jgi:hypothetical protein
MNHAALPIVLAAAALALAPAAAGTAPKALVLEDVHVVRGGRTVVAQASVHRGRHGRRVRWGSVSCLGALGNGSLAVHKGRFARGLASCRWRLGAKARGKRFRGTIFVQSRRASGRAFFAVRLR